jgi:hypothetical protein
MMDPRPKAEDDIAWGSAPRNNTLENPRKKHGNIPQAASVLPPAPAGMPDQGRRLPPGRRYEQGRRNL